MSADLENGYSDDPKTAAQALVRGAEAGLVGGSIEDFSGKVTYDFTLAVERVQAAAEAVEPPSHSGVPWPELVQQGV